jgi:hypothetical protein
LTPVSDLTLCALAEGWSYNRLIQSVLNAGARRYGLMDGADAGTDHSEKNNLETSQG